LISLQKNKDYSIDISGMTHEGQGVGRIENLAVFVDGAILGETVQVKIVKLNKSYAIGKLINITTPSKDRITPFCQAYGKCGGCSLQHMTYEAQLEFKTNTVKDAIRRIGKLEEVAVHDTIGMDNGDEATEGKALNYRNKAQYPVGMGDNGAIVGFYAKRSHRIVENEHCGIQDLASSEIRKVFKAFVRENKIDTYDETTGKGLVRHLMTRVGIKTGEIMVVVVINGRELPFKEKLVKLLTDKLPAVKSIYLNVNTENTNIILGEKNIKLYGNDTITDFIGKYKFKISPHSFYQVNSFQTEVLYGKVLEYAGLSGKEVVFDLYCGIGTISLFLSKKAKKVYGVEVVEAAVRDARRNAELNGVGNVEFVTGEAEKVIPEMYEQGIKADVVVVDPPRKGCDEVLLETLVGMAPERIVYVSCNPATLARDLGYLAERGYAVREAQPVDMFPWTGHVETVVCLNRKHSESSD